MYHCDCARPRTSTTSYIFLHVPSVKVLCRVRHSVTQFAANLSLDNDSWTVQECGCEARQTHCVPRVSSPRALRRQTVRHQPEHALTGSIFITTPAGPRPDWIHTSRTVSRLDPCTITITAMRIDMSTCKLTRGRCKVHWRRSGDLQPHRNTSPDI